VKTSLLPKTIRKYEKTLLPVLIYIEEHLDEQLSLNHLAALAGFSPFHFHRIFQRVTGETPKEYLRRLRLERAVYRLKVSPDSVLTIALEAGFKTHESFTRAFLQQYEMNPSEFRATLKAYRACIDDAFGSYTFAGFSLDSPLLIRQEPRKEPINLEDLPAQPVIFKRYLGPYEDLLADGQSLLTLWDELLDYAERHQLNVDPSRLMAICHDDPYVTDPAKIRFDACLPVDGPVTASHPIGYRIIQAGLSVVRRHFGGLEEIAKTFAFIGVEWLPTDNYLLRAAPPFEVHHCKVIDGQLERLYTDAYVPLDPKKKSA
jgi:AraC family transcriptional regulator